MHVADAQPHPRRSTVLPMFAVLFVTVVAAVLVQRLGHEPREADTTAVLPFGG